MNDKGIQILTLPERPRFSVGQPMNGSDSFYFKGFNVV
jgi:hypothetical protein